MSQLNSGDDLFEIKQGEAGLEIIALGLWTKETVGRLDAQLTSFLDGFSAPNPAPKTAVIYLSGLDRLDTFGAFLVCATVDKLNKKGFAASIEGIQENHALLLDEINKAAKVLEVSGKKKGALRNFVEEVLIKGVAGIGQDIQTFLNFLGVVTLSLGTMILNPKRFNMTAFVHHMEYVGLRAIPIISLICFLIGAVIMQQGIVMLSKFGIDSFALSMTTVLSLREVGVLLTAILVAGRSSSAFTAEIGSMKMREEVDAMHTLGIDPIESLVVPRILALVIMMPFLVFIADFMCLVGGGVMAYFYMGMSAEAYIDSLHKWASLKHFMAGMIKTPFIAVAIAIVGCVEGLKVGGSAESLGHHVTSAVVKSIFLVMILDAMFAILLAAIQF